MDLSIPPAGALAAIRLIKAEKPNIAVVVLTRYSDPSFVREALTAGASGYVLKQSSFNELRQAIEVVIRGDRYLDARLTAALTRILDDEVGVVSNRESDVLRRTALGQSNKDISTALAISIRTVEIHKTHGMRKLALRDRSDLVRYASVQGWLSEP